MSTHDCFHQPLPTISRQVLLVLRRKGPRPSHHERPSDPPKQAVQIRVGAGEGAAVQMAERLDVHTRRQGIFVIRPAEAPRAPCVRSFFIWRCRVPLHLTYLQAEKVDETSTIPSGSAARLSRQQSGTVITTRHGRMSDERVGPFPSFLVIQAGSRHGTSPPQLRAPTRRAA